ncbi:MAG: hypothetical protein ACR2P6_01145 [Gammaproteobacteria bacterium]
MMRIPAGKLLFRSLSIALLLLAASAASAAPLQYEFDYVFDGGTQDTLNEDDYGNTWNYTIVDPDLGPYTVSITSWSDEGFVDLDSTLNAASGVELGNGLGVCNDSEGSSVAQCSGQAGRRNIDNRNGHDWVLIMLPEVMRIDTLTITPEGNRERDVTYFTGWLDTDEQNLAGVSYNDLTGAIAGGGLNMTRYDAYYSRSTQPQIIDLYANAGNTEVWGNAVLLGASMLDDGERFRITSMSTSVPVPASAWLFLSALGLFFWRGQRTRRVRLTAAYA